VKELGIGVAESDHLLLAVTTLSAIVPEAVRLGNRAQKIKMYEQSFAR